MQCSFIDLLLLMRSERRWQDEKEQEREAALEGGKV